MTEIKRFACELLELKLGDANSDMGVFSGYASVWNSVDLGGDQIQAGAFAKTLEEWKNKGMLPQMLFYHDMGDIIGEWTKMHEDEKGLYVEGRLWVKGDERLDSAVKAFNVLKSNSVKGLSIGFHTKEFEIIDFNGGQIRKLIELSLMEVSIAPFAMEPKASVTAVKSLTGEDGQILSKREVEKVLRDANLSTKQAKAFISGGYNSMVRDESSEDLSSILASINSILKERTA